MAIVDWDAFGDEKVTRVYLAARLREAQNVETTLSSHGVDYAVEIEPFTTYLFGIIRRQHKGVAFYVLLNQADFSRQRLLDAGLKKGLIDEEPEENTDAEPPDNVS